MRWNWDVRLATIPEPSALPELNSRDIKKQLSAPRKNWTRCWLSYAMQVMRPPYGTLSQDPHKKSDIWVVEAIEEAGYLHAVRWM